MLLYHPTVYSASRRRKSAEAPFGADAAGAFDALDGAVSAWRISGLMRARVDLLLVPTGSAPGQRVGHEQSRLKSEPWQKRSS